MSSEFCKYSYICQIHDFHFRFADISVSVCEQNLSYVFLCWEKISLQIAQKLRGQKKWCIHSPISGFFTYFRVECTVRMQSAGRIWIEGVALWLCGSVALWAKILAPRGLFESAQVSKAEKTAALIAMHRGNTLFQTLPWNIHFCNLYDHVWGVFAKLTFLCLSIGSDCGVRLLSITQY